MVYELVDNNQPIQQGDIFKDLPIPFISIEKETLIYERDSAKADKKSIKRAFQSSSCSLINASFTLQRGYGIVITQNCDAIRDPRISFCFIDKLFEIYPTEERSRPKNTKSWASFLSGQVHNNPGIFYLPPSTLYRMIDIGFNERMAVDFSQIFNLDREELEQNKTLRIGRLGSVANEHFREKLSNYFRRFAYNNWMPLTKDEFEEYKYKDVSEPYFWQQE